MGALAGSSRMLVAALHGSCRPDPVDSYGER